MKPLSILFLLLFLFGCKPKPVTHNITFAPYSYSPAEMEVRVGDTIEWSGNFSSHPLASASIPEGAATINRISEGADYRYVVTVPGVYNYQCENHHHSGMTGTFTAAAP